MFGISELSFNFLTGHPFITALIFALFILLSFYLYRSTNPPLSRGMKIVFISLRVIAVVALFLALFEPVVSFEREYKQKPILTILADRSGSMNIVDEAISRTMTVDSILNDERFKKFLSHFNFEVAEFSSDIFNENNRLITDRTGLGRSLKSASEREVGQPAEAWLLLSDGISNDGIAPVEVCKSLKTPVYSIGIGVQSEDRDVSISSLSYNDIVFAGKPTEMTAHIAWNGLNNEKIRVNIKNGDKVIGGEEIVASSGNVKEDVKIKFVADSPGQQTFQLSLSGIENEVTIDNNSRSFPVTVLKSKMNLLLVSDRLDWEFAFLKRFLSNSESVSLETVVYRNSGGYLTGQFPTRKEEINRYDLVILYDIDINKLKNHAKLFDTYLRDKGGSVFVIQGENYLKASFPRWLDDFLPCVNKSADERFIYSKFNGVPSENYLFHPAVKLSDNRQSIRESWRSLPNFEVLVPTDSIAPNSEILVTADLELGGDSQSVVGLRKIGSGRVLAMNALPLWHWAFYGFGFGDDDKEYRLLLDGIVNWLSVKEESDPIKIKPDKNVYTRGEMVGFNLFAFDLGYRAINNANGYIKLINITEADTVVSQLIHRGEGQYRAEFELVPPGQYEYYGRVEQDGKLLKEGTGQIAVENFAIEEYYRQPDFTQLSNISRLTGGRFFGIADIDSIYSIIDTTVNTVETRSEIVLWNKIWVLLTFIFTLGIEWFLRKRYQLI